MDAADDVTFTLRGDHAHEVRTRRGITVLSSAAAAGVATNIATFLSGRFPEVRPVDNGETATVGIVPIYLGLVLALIVVGIWARGANIRRRVLWIALVMLLPPALYLLPVWWLSAPLVLGCIGSGASAFLIGHRQRCRRIKSFIRQRGPYGQQSVGAGR